MVSCSIKAGHGRFNEHTHIFYVIDRDMSIHNSEKNEKNTIIKGKERRGAKKWRSFK